MADLQFLHKAKHSQNRGDSPTPFKIAAVVTNEVSLLLAALMARMEPMMRMDARVAR